VEAWGLWGVPVSATVEGDLRQPQLFLFPFSGAGRLIFEEVVFEVEAKTSFVVKRT
jgi:hypothetical protein